MKRFYCRMFCDGCSCICYLVVAYVYSTSSGKIRIKLKGVNCDSNSDLTLIWMLSSLSDGLGIGSIIAARGCFIPGRCF